MSGTTIAMLLSASLAGNPSPATTRQRSDTPATAQADASTAARGALDKAYAAFKDGDFALAARLLQEQMDAPAFAKLPEDARYAITLLAGHVAVKRQRPEQGLRLLTAATAFKQADADDWFTRTDAAMAASDMDEAARSLALLLRQWPAEATNLNEYSVHRILGKRNGASHEAPRRELLESLFDANWVPANTVADECWMELTGLLLAGNDAAKALEVARRIDGPRQIAAMRVDRRFDALAKIDGTLFDVDRAIERTEKKDKERIRANPDLLRPVAVQLANQLDAARYRQVVMLADRVVALVQRRDGGALYKDFDDEYVWIIDQRAEALARLGRWDEAVRQREKAARRPEDGGMNVSQVINLAELYNQLGRANDAREAIEETGPVSPYGRMQLEMVRLQAAVTLGDRKAAEAARDYLRSHRGDAISTWQYALIIDDDLDEAAALLIERLRREEWRDGALLSAQNWAAPARTPILAEQAKRWKRLFARSDVQAAVAGVGRIESFPLAEARH